MHDLSACIWSQINPQCDTDQLTLLQSNNHHIIDISIIDLRLDIFYADSKYICNFNKPLFHIDFLCYLIDLYVTL